MYISSVLDGLRDGDGLLLRYAALSYPVLTARVATTRRRPASPLLLLLLLQWRMKRGDVLCMRVCVCRCMHSSSAISQRTPLRVCQLQVLTSCDAQIQGIHQLLLLLTRVCLFVYLWRYSAVVACACVQPALPTQDFSKQKQKYGEKIFFTKTRNIKKNKK